jgi:hypothetical protein
VEDRLHLVLQRAAQGLGRDLSGGDQRRAEHGALADAAGQHLLQPGDAQLAA